MSPYEPRSPRFIWARLGSSGSKSGRVCQSLGESGKVWDSLEESRSLVSQARCNLGASEGISPDSTRHLWIDEQQSWVPVVMHPVLPPRHAVCARCSWTARGTAGLGAVQLGCGACADRQTRPDCNCNCNHYTLQISRRRRRPLRRLRRWLRVLQGTAGQLS